MPRTAGEMPFLDHLEELRSRILRSLLAVVGCFAVGLWLVNRFHLIDMLKRPIAEYLPGGQRPQLPIFLQHRHYVAEQLLGALVRLVIPDVAAGLAVGFSFAALFNRALRAQLRPTPSTAAPELLTVVIVVALLALASGVRISSTQFL